jgi:hypothetical protein
MATSASNRLKESDSPSAEHKSPSIKEERRPIDDLVHYAVEYAREKPELAALWCLGIGFVLGWKLKPW